MPVLALLTLAPIAPVAAQQIFYPVPPLVPSLGEPRGVALGRLDGDLDIDMASSNTVAGRILIHRGRGDGSFRVPTNIFVGGSPSELLCVDLDRDGLTDLVWADVVTGAIGILYQLPTTPSTYRLVHHPGADEAESVAPWDRDGDGWPDLVVAHRGADAVSVYPNLDGDLGRPQVIPAGDGPVLVRAVPRPLGAVDQLAVVQAGYLSRDLVVFDGAGVGLAQRFSMAGPTWLEVADLNGDPWPDLVVLDGAAGRVGTLTGSETGIYDTGLQFDVQIGSQHVYTAVETPGAARWFVAETERNRISAYEQAPSGVSRTGSWFVGEQVRRLSWGDVDRDGIDELVVPLPLNDGLQVIEPIAAGLLAPEAVDTGAVPKTIVRADDPAAPASPVLAVLCEGTGEVWTYTVLDHRLVRREVIDVAAGAVNQRWADLDGSGRSDLVVAVPEAGVDVHRDDPAGGYRPAARVPLAEDVRDIALLDVVGGPELDLVVATATLPGLRIYLGDGAGGFSLSSSIVLGEQPVRLRQHDLDLDGRDEIVSLGQLAQVSLFFNRATGLGAPVIFSTGENPRDAGFGHFNADVYPDIAIANAGGQSFSVVVSVLKGVYSTSTSDAVAPDGADNVVVVDVDGNGADDLIFSSPSSQSASIHVNTGNASTASGTFGVPSRVRVASLPRSLEALPLDGDARPDLVVVDVLGEILVVLRSDPLSLLPAPTLSLSARRQGSSVELEVSGSAASANEFVLRRVRDGRAVPVQEVARGRWWGQDALPADAAESYRLLARTGDLLASAAVSAVDPTAAASEAGWVLLPPRREGERSILRFRVGTGTEPRVTVYDLRGRRVAAPRVLEEGDRWFRAIWSGEDLRGRPTARGRYLVEVRAGGHRLHTSFLRP